MTHATPDDMARELQTDRNESMSKDQELIRAAINWGADRRPRDPGDAALMKALWSYAGDNKGCPDCDGDCGEPCRPCTVVEAHARLDGFTADWMEKNGHAK